MSTTPSTTAVAPATTPTPKPPSASLYVGDLAPEVTEGMLFEVFNTVGPVSSIRVCRDTLTRRSLGYAYVNFHSVLDAERALDTTNNQVISSRPCRIMWSQRDPSIRKTGVGNIFIKNLDPKIGHKELYDTFSQFGNILSCKVVFDDKGNSKGYGFVHFENQSSAETAVETANNNLMLDKKVFVGPFVPRKVRAQQLEKSWTNVFIKDIDASIDDAALHTAFSQFGEVTSAVIMRNDDGAHTGFGFVNFREHESAVRAVNEMHGQKLGNKNLYCCRAQKKAEREQRLKREWEQQKISKYQGINLYIKNIEDEIDEERLKKEFSAYGTIKSCKIMTDEKGNSKGFGFVCFSTPEESQQAITEMNNRILPSCTKPLYVALHEPKEIRRQKLTLNALKGLRGGVPQGAPGAMYGPAGQVYYPGSNMSQGFVYPQQMMASMPRGWQPQYPVPPHAGYANNVGVAPRSGAPATSRGRGGASGATRGGGASRGRRNNQPAQMVEAAAVAAAQQSVDLSLEQIKQYAADQQKILLGERLYPLIAMINHNLAGKITGMFLDSGWSIEELYSLLSDSAKLQEKIEDALNVLERANSGQTETAEATATEAQ